MKVVRAGYVNDVALEFDHRCNEQFFLIAYVLRSTEEPEKAGDLFMPLLPRCWIHLRSNAVAYPVLAVQAANIVRFMSAIACLVLVNAIGEVSCRYSLRS